MPFKNLFKSSDKPQDGLTQPAREAIVDVLHYCMYADKHIAAREDEFVESAARSLNWDTRISYEYYEGKSTGAVRAALSDKKAREDFFETLKSRLPAKADRDLALRLAADLSVVDGSKSQSEVMVIAELKAALSA